MIRRISFASAILASTLLFPAISNAAEVSYRDLVKLPDDGNPSTQFDSTVYYVADDGQRYVYPNEKIYFSWRLDYSGVKIVSASQMAQLPLGGNITYRAGTRLVKLQSDPKTYVVEPKGNLRWLADGGVAAALYGNAWNKRVDDLSDAFFGDYRVGAPLDAVVYPSGSVVKAAGLPPEASAQGGETYYVEGSTKRRIASAAVLSDLRYRTSDVLAATDLTTYADGATLGTAEPDLTDDAQLGLVYVPPVATEPRTTFEVALYPEAGTDAVRGEKGVTLASFILKATSDAPNRVTSIAFQGRIDENEGDNDFGVGFDTDDGTTTFLKDIVSSTSLYGQDGVLIAGPFGVGEDGRTVLSGFALDIPAGASKVVILKADLSAAAEVQSRPDVVAFDIENVASDVAVSTTAGAAVPKTGARPNNGAAPIVAVAVREKGTIDFKWVGRAGFLVAGRQKEEIGYLEARTTYDAYELQTLTLRTIGNMTSIQDWILEYTNADGTTATLTVPYGGANTVIGGLTIPIVKNGYTTVRVWANMKSKSVAQLNEEVKVDIVPDQPLRFVSKATGAVYTDANLSSGDYGLSSRTATLYVRHTLISASVATDTPWGALPRTPAAPVLKFNVRAEPEGDARLVKMVFKITPGDAGTISSPNDALEKWAARDGDFAKDKGMINLYRLSGASPVLLAEDSLSSIDYSVVHFDVRDDTPQGIVSAGNDYGLVTYQFNSSDEQLIAAGETASFLVQLDMTAFAPNSHTLKVELLGGFDFAWTDAIGSGYEPITGLEIPGLPVTSAGLTVNP